MFKKLYEKVTNEFLNNLIEFGVNVNSMPKCRICGYKMTIVKVNENGYADDGQRILVDLYYWSCDYSQKLREK